MTNIKFLQPGDLLKVISPSGTLRESTNFERGLEIWKSRGYRVELSPGFDDRWGYLAGSDENRVLQLADALNDPDCRGILCARGGFGSTRLLEKGKVGQQENAKLQESKNAPCPIPDAQFPTPDAQFPTINIPDWQMRLEILIAYLAPEYRDKVAANLQLPADSIKRLQYLEAGKKQLAEHLPKCNLPSKLVLLLRNYELPVLIAIALQSPRSVRRQIWEYLTKWANVDPPLNGNDLKALGYKPGPGFKRMLDDLLAATLDGHLGDRTDASSFLAQRYPQA